MAIVLYAASMWMLVIAAALAIELVPEWEVHGTAISPETPLDAALIGPRAMIRRESFLQRSGEPLVIGDVVLQPFRVRHADPDRIESTSLIVEKNKLRSHTLLFRGDHILFDAVALPGDLIQVNWGSDAALYATILGFDADGVIQKVAEDIPIRIGMLELQLSLPTPGQLVIRGTGVTSSQARWIGGHDIGIRPPREDWTPRTGAIPLGDLSPAAPEYAMEGEVKVNDYALRWGHYDKGGPTHDAVWVFTPQGRVPLLLIPDQNNQPARLNLRAFRRLHGHTYWAEIELVVAGLHTDTTYYLGWILQLRRDEARILADQIPVRAGGRDHTTRLLVDVPTPDQLVIEAGTKQLSYWQNKWLGTWSLE